MQLYKGEINHEIIFDYCVLYNAFVAIFVWKINPVCGPGIGVTYAESFYRSQNVLGCPRPKIHLHIVAIANILCQSVMVFCYHNCSNVL